MTKAKIINRYNESLTWDGKKPFQDGLEQIEKIVNKLNSLSETLRVKFYNNLSSVTKEQIKLEEIKMQKYNKLEKSLRDLFRANKKKIMRSVHKKNAFGQTASQIDFYINDNKVVINILLTPAWHTNSRTPDLTMTIQHDPFYSYTELEERFENALEQTINYLESLNK